MRRDIWTVAIVFALAGCARTPVAKQGIESPAPDLLRTNAPITRAAPMPGRIDSVKPKGGYVIVSFPIGTMPPIDSRLSVYRKGLKVAELKVTPPQQNNFTAADIIAGECQEGDEVRVN